MIQYTYHVVYTYTHAVYMNMLMYIIHVHVHVRLTVVGGSTFVCMYRFSFTQ